MNYKLNNVTLMIFTDIDGTFIDNDTFYEGDNFDIARELCANNHVFVFNSSKTFHEIISLQTKHSTNYPFICETGGGIYHRSLPQHEPCKIRGDYDVIFESKKVSSFQRLIKEEIYKNFKDDIDLFEDLDYKEKARLSGLSGNDLLLASKRDFSILITWKSDYTKYQQFESILKGFGLNIVKGARFCHICGPHDKGKAVRYYLDRIKSYRGDEKFITVGVGDSSNDIEMLANVDYACVVKSKNNENLINKINNNNIIYSKNPAPIGWADCIKDVFLKIKSTENTHV